MNQIQIADLEVSYRVGVPDAERAQPQRLLLTVLLECDFTAAIHDDDLAATIDYYAVSQYLLDYGQHREWKLIEKLAGNIAADLLAKFKPQRVSVEVKKFIISQARYVSVTVTRPQAQPGPA